MLDNKQTHDGQIFSLFGIVPGIVALIVVAILDGMIV